MKISKNILIISILISFLLISCTKIDEEFILEIETKTLLDITFLHYFSGSLSGGIDDMVEVYNNSQDDYLLSAIAIDHEAFKTSITKTLESDVPPDIYSYWAGSKVYSILEHLTPITDIWNDNLLSSQFHSNIIDSACTYDGDIYLLPITQHYVTIFYNKNLFNELNLSIPTNWEEFLYTCEVLKTNNKTPISLGAKDKWPAQFWFDYILLGTAGYEYRQDLMNGKNKYTDDEVKNVFAIWSNLVTKGYFNADATVTNWDNQSLMSIINEDAGMTLMGTWAISVLNNLDENFKQESDYDFFKFPIFDVNIKSSALGPIDGVVIPKNAENIVGAKNAVIFLAEEEAQKTMGLGSGAFIPSKSVDHSFYTPMQRRMLLSINSEYYWAFNYDLSTPPEIANLGLNLFVDFLEFPEEYELLLNEMQEKVDILLEK